MTVKPPPPAAWPEPGETLRPDERAQLGAMITRARSRKVSIGSPGATYHWDLSHLDRVIAFHPPDMVLPVETGQSLNAVKDAAEAERLWLPLDSPGSSHLPLADYLAEDHSLSWLSHRYGTARDWVMSMTVVDDQGREVTSGARVVKNVAGYQLAPLYIGARDALGPVVEVAFRLLPLPVPLTVARWQADSPAPLLAVWQAARRSGHPSGRGDPWEGLRLERRTGRWRLDGITRFLPDAVAAWGHDAGCNGQEVITQVDIPPREADVNDLPAMLRIQVLPTQLAALLEPLHSLGPDLVCYPAAGVIHLGSPEGTVSRRALSDVLATVAAKGGLVLPLAAGVGIDLPPQTRPTGERQIMARVKRFLDPDGVFGPLAA